MTLSNNHALPRSSHSLITLELFVQLLVSSNGFAGTAPRGQLKGGIPPTSFRNSHSRAMQHNKQKNDWSFHCCAPYGQSVIYGLRRPDSRGKNRKVLHFAIYC